MPRMRRPPLALLAVLAGGLLVLAGLLVALSGGQDAGVQRAPTRAQLLQPAPRADRAAPVTVRADAVPRRHARAPRPVRIVIPAIGVDAPVIPLGLDRAGALEVPRRFSDTGWWTGGSRPGERGPAVIAGHVDSHTGPAAFFRLRDLRHGAAITVERADGSRVRFHVQRSARYPKTRFPTAEVYGRTAAPTLRLVTCSGTFDRVTGHYLDNTVVYAGR